MAKGKSANPADAYRKAQRAKEIKKNKENRAKSRETATLKKDTSGLETEIHELEDIGEGKLNSTQKSRLKELRTEVDRIRKIKQDYVKAHPEQSHLVRGLNPRARHSAAGNGASASAGGSVPATRSLFGKNGLPLHPERSIYYDPVLNPYGVPPPGMPYAERPLLPHEMEDDDQQGTLDEDSAMNSGSDGSEDESDDDDDDDDDDDIVLPAGPPPDQPRDASDDESSDSGSDDDIPMPPGPPPPKAAPPLPAGVPPAAPFHPSVPYGATLPPFPPTAQPVAYMPHVPPPPPGFPTNMPAGHAPYFVQPALPYPPQIPFAGPPRDRQFAEAVRVVQDPLSNVPHVTFQAHQAQRHQLPPATASLPHGLPPKPGSVSQAAASATISAEPELRDFKKEATAFVPTSMRRAAKKGGNAGAPSGIKIDAAPNETGDDHGGPSAEPRKDLMSVLGSQLGVPDKPSTASNNKGGQGKDDYEKFLAEVGSFL